jgi:hypothetical protein
MESTTSTDELYPLALLIDELKVFSMISPLIFGPLLLLLLLLLLVAVVVVVLRVYLLY